MAESQHSLFPTLSAETAWVAYGTGSWGASKKAGTPLFKNTLYPILRRELLEFHTHQAFSCFLDYLPQEDLNTQPVLSAWHPMVLNECAVGLRGY